MSGSDGRRDGGVPRHLAWRRLHAGRLAARARGADGQVSDVPGLGRPDTLDAIVRVDTRARLRNTARQPDASCGWSGEALRAGLGRPPSGRSRRACRGDPDPETSEYVNGQHRAPAPPDDQRGAGAEPDAAVRRRLVARQSGHTDRFLQRRQVVGAGRGVRAVKGGIQIDVDAPPRANHPLGRRTWRGRYLDSRGQAVSAAGRPDPARRRSGRSARSGGGSRAAAIWCWPRSGGRWWARRPDQAGSLPSN